MMQDGTADPYIESTIRGQMSRKMIPLTLDAFAKVPAPCRSCLFWELDPVRRRRLHDENATAAKEDWISGVLRDWGSCGRVITVDDEAVGYLLYAPPSLVPGADAFPTSPVSPDAVLLTAVWIAPEHTGGGLGRMLVQGMARDLIRRGGIAAVEAFGDTGPASGLHGSRCAPPVDFLAHVGFKTHRPHLTAPRMRMELTRTVSWRDEVEEAWDRLVGVVRPRRKHAPAPLPRRTE